MFLHIGENSSEHACHVADIWKHSNTVLCL